VGAWKTTVANDAPAGRPGFRPVHPGRIVKSNIDAPDKTIEQRVTEIEERLSHLEQEWQSIPELIEARLRLTDSRVAKLSSDMTGVKRALGEPTGKVDALPRALAEMLAERNSRS
jgi:hypothetical protein